MASFEDINYSLRPNKSIERKMICEAFQKLAYIGDLRDYRYIGMGSAYFTDFILFHKYFGLDKMISIEKEESKIPRMEFNKPYKCIEMRYGTTTTVLPNLDLQDHLNLIWLDYDGKIDDFMFADLDSVVANAKAGSMFLISVNTEPDNHLPKKEDKMKALIEKVGKERIPSIYSDTLLNTKNYPIVIYEMINRQIRKTLLERTGGDDKRLDYLQLFHYIYEDGAQMLTVGGILYDEKQKKELVKMKFAEINHLSTDNNSIKIKCPNLTYKEVHHLNNLLPCELKIAPSGIISNKEFKKIPLNTNDIKNFAAVYRYYPNFAEANL
ncbi:O-methyltransferase [Chryseobacterium salivictor]|uniref:Uncharacterized protein n=1 Tax=Chryseobacterium salivictor TaxID=2547600 RepID=A0A4P6ZIA9_9FLAO|nr:O-methyltransferase [Chryseobacterium salivictor]QBO59352.1 hypothetical protein NBC122_02548 [Chryseobacterium salivictor]